MVNMSEKSLDNEIDEFVDSHIKYLRRMNLLDDDQLRHIFKMKAIEDPSILEKFKENKMKKELDTIKELAKSMQTPATKLGRKVA